MKRCMCFVMVFMMFLALSAIPAQAESSLTFVKSEDFTGTVIDSESKTISGTNGLAATKVNPQRAIGEVVSGGLGGKTETDKYLLVTRNSEIDAASYYFGIVLPADGNTYTEGNPVTVGFSVYAPEGLGSDPFICQFGPMADADTSTPSPIGAVYFVTDENAVVTNGGSLATQRFFVNAGEWNRISLTMYPNTTNTDVTVNGTSYKYTVINASRTYGTYLRSLRMQLPIRAGKTDEFMAYDDFVIYSGAGTESYTAPANALSTSSNNVLIGEDTVYINGAVNPADFTVENGELCAINDEAGKPKKLAVWVTNNPIPKYYNIEFIGTEAMVALSLTADAEAHSFIAKGYANGAAGTVIVAEYSKTDGALLGAVMYELADAAGSFETVCPIVDYNAEKTYQAFWWDSINEMRPYLKCDF